MTTLANDYPNGPSYLAEHLEAQLLAKAAKKGEGSRGGHIIGHTKSGKPIYGPSSEHKILGKTSSGKSITSARRYPEIYRPVRGNHHNDEHVKGWGEHLVNALPEHTAVDHLEAAAAHEKERASLLKQDRWGEAHASELASLAHAHAARIAGR